MRTVGLVFPETPEKPKKGAKIPEPEQEKETANEKEK